MGFTLGFFFSVLFAVLIGVAQTSHCELLRRRRGVFFFFFFLKVICVILSSSCAAAHMDATCAGK